MALSLKKRLVGTHGFGEGSSWALGLGSVWRNVLVDCSSSAGPNGCFTSCRGGKEGCIMGDYSRETAFNRPTLIVSTLPFIWRGTVPSPWWGTSKGEGGFWVEELRLIELRFVESKFVESRFVQLRVEVLLPRSGISAFAEKI